LSQPPCRRDVVRLRALVAAAKQNCDPVATTLELNPAARAIVYAQFADPVADGSDVARIAETKSVDPLQDACSPAPVPKRLEPIRKLPRRHHLNHMDLYSIEDNCQSRIYHLPPR